MTDTLANCPFCGGEARSGQRHTHSGDYMAFVSCRSCPIEMEKYVGDYDDPDVLEQSLIATWNTRAAPTVRPLVWVNNGRNGALYSNKKMHGLFSYQYIIEPEEYGLATVTFGISCHEFGSDVVWKGPIADAQAAADAHHAAYILSCIEGQTE